MSKRSHRFARHSALLAAPLLACSASRPPTASSPRRPPRAAPAAPAAPAAAAAAPRAARGRRLEHDEHATLGADGAGFTAPAGWSLATADRRATLVSPEGDATLVLLESDPALPDADAAVAAAWRAVQPGFAREVRHRAAPPAHEGWDEIVQLNYRTAPSESRVLVAIARRKAARWYVALIDATVSGIDRRGAQVQTTIQTFRAAGTGEESWAGRTLRPLDAERTAALERFVREAMQQEHVPGVALAFVTRDGAGGYAQGFGARALGGREPVTPRTLFMIGSITKSFTSLLMARQVDAGRFQWTTPVVQVLPAFRLADAAVTRRIEMQHTVCACTGMPRRDLEFIFEYAGATPEHWLEVLGGMAPTTGFGEVFQYSNLLVAAGGFAAARAVRPAGDLASAVRRAMHDELFAPLGMRRTTLAARDAARDEHAEPHGRDVRNEPVREPLSVEGGVETVGPAGAMWSNLEDMSRYAALELRDGALLDGRRFVSAAALTERRRPRVHADEHRSYGLGLVVSDAHGVPSFGHSGGTLGFSSDLVVYPEQGFAIIVLANAVGSHALISLVERRLLELVLAARPEAESQLAFRRADVARRVAEELARIDAAPARGWYGPLLGRYRNPSLGAIELAERGGALVLDAGEWSSRVGREHHAGGAPDTLVLLDPPLTGVDFQPPASPGGSGAGASGATAAAAAAATAGLLLDYPQSPYRFEREVVAH